MNKYLFSSTMYLMSSQVLAIILSLSTQIILARQLMPEGRGVYALCIVYASLFILFTNLGNEFGIRFLLLKKKIRLFDSFFYLILTLFISLSASVFLIFFLRYFDVNFLQRVSAYQIILALFFSATNVMCRQTNVLLTIEKKFKQASLIYVIDELLKLILLLLIVSKFKSVEFAFLSLIIANIITLVFYTLFFDLIRLNSENICFDNLRFIYKYGFYSFFTNLSNLANAHIGTLVLSIYLNNYKIGIYSVAYGLASRFQVLPDTLNRIFVPISNDLEEKINEKLSLFTSFLFYVMLIVVIIIFLYGDFIVTILFGNDYKESVLILKILSVGYLFKTLTKPFEALYNEIKGKPIIISILSVFGTVILGLSMLIFSKFYGLIGAAIVASVTLALMFMIILIFHKRKQKIKFYKYFNLIDVLNYFYLFFHKLKR